MREIKFRAWDKQEKYMEEISWPWAILDNKLYDITGQKKHKESGEIVLMQYTGLHDKNGKEIYERDVVKTPGENNQYVVRYGYIQPSDDMTAPGVGFQFNDEPEKMEVIGNIYENPELLKVKHD